MRQKKDVKIDDKEFTVKELTVREIIDFFEKSGDIAPQEPGKTPAKKKSGSKKKPNLDATSTDLFKKQLQEFIDLAFVGKHNIDQFIKMTPSEIKTLWDAFDEVNAVFFQLARKMGMDKIVEHLGQQLQEQYLGLLVSL